MRYPAAGGASSVAAELIPDRAFHCSKVLSNSAGLSACNVAGSNREPCSG
jgi:hypothetical protein